jgi:hypothetical protein
LVKREPLTDELEARNVLASKVVELRARGYDRLRSIRRRGFIVSGPSELVEIPGESGLM